LVFQRRRGGDREIVMTFIEKERETSGRGSRRKPSVGARDRKKNLTTPLREGEEDREIFSATGEDSD